MILSSGTCIADEMGGVVIVALALRLEVVIPELNAAMAVAMAVAEDGSGWQ